MKFKFGRGECARNDGKSISFDIFTSAHTAKKRTTGSCKRPGTSYRIEIHFAIFNHLYLLFSSMKLIEHWNNV